MFNVSKSNESKNAETESELSKKEKFETENIIGVPNNYLITKTGSRSELSKNSDKFVQIGEREVTKKRKVNKREFFFKICKEDKMNIFSEMKNSYIYDDKLKNYKCNFENCDKMFPKRSNFVDHLRTHTGERPYKCSSETCGKSFTQIGNLKKHLTLHYGFKAYTCDFAHCNKEFSSVFNLKVLILIIILFLVT